MKTLITSYSAVEEVFDRVVSTPISISGHVYKLSRPVNSKKEDIVIIPLAMNAEQMQEGVINVNVHVPNLRLGKDNTQPNNPRMAAISQEVMAALDDYWGYSYNFHLDNAGHPERDGDGWYNNIRVRFHAFRKDI